MASKTKYPCPNCEEQLSDLKTLARHKAKHEPPGGFLCSLCNAPFTSTESRQKHKREYHKVYHCSTCKDKFDVEQKYLDHVETLHAGNIQSHERCNTCGTQFRTKIQLRHHVESNCGREKRFKCDVCNRHYQTNASLRTHKLSHQTGKRALCYYCGASFQNRGQLKIHERVHTGEKPYKCDKCDKSFGHRESLITHSTIHTGVKPFFCKCCYARFSCVGNLITHRKIRPETCGLPEFQPIKREAPRPTKKTMPSLTDLNNITRKLNTIVALEIRDRRTERVIETGKVTSGEHMKTQVDFMITENENEEHLEDISESVNVADVVSANQNTVYSLVAGLLILNQDDPPSSNESVEVFVDFEREIDANQEDDKQYTLWEVNDTMVVQPVEDPSDEHSNGNGEEMFEQPIVETTINNEVTTLLEPVTACYQHLEPNLSLTHQMDYRSENPQDGDPTNLAETAKEDTRTTHGANRQESEQNVSLTVDRRYGFENTKEDESYTTDNATNRTGRLERVRLKQKPNVTLSEQQPMAELSLEELNEMIIEKKDEQLQEQLEIVRQNSEACPNFYGCKLCLLQYTSEYLMARHLERVHNFQLDKAREKLRFVNGTVNEKQFRCKYCNRSYVNASRLKLHIGKHGAGGRLKHKCSGCVQYFETEEAARQHALQQHRERLVCDICNREFKDPMSLRVHVRYSHNGPKEGTKLKFMCHRCGKYLYSRTTMSDHERANCGESPIYRCETCGKHYASFASLKTHRTMHENVLPFDCGYCQKRYRTKGQLKVHQRMHTGEKPYRCEHCPKSFPYRESLLTHRATHTGIKRFACSGCNRTFTCIANMQSHRRSHRTTCGAVPINTKCLKIQ